MFWAKVEALAPLMKLNLKVSDFDAEAGQVDSTLAHAVERTLLLYVESAGFEWLKVIRSDSDYPYKRCMVNVKNVAELRKSHVKTFRPLLHTRSFGSNAAERSIPEIRPLNYIPSDKIRPRFNLLINSINPAHTFGGVTTALSILRDFMRSFAGRADFRVIALDAEIDRAAKNAFSGFDFLPLGAEDEDGERVVVDAFYREVGPLNLRANDIFFTTAWWTAEIARGARKAQMSMFGASHPQIYLIQDFEPNFYPWGAKWTLAENTYRQASDVIAIFNSEELFEHFGTLEYDFLQKYCIPYKLNTNLAKMLSSRYREKIILIYGRPSVPRNAFEVLVDGLVLWQRRNPVQADTWKIISLGETYEPEIAEPLQYLVVLGKVSLEEYAAWLSKSSIGLSLMVSPHPSYPPLEMANGGLMTITNGFGTRDGIGKSANVKTLVLVSAENISDSIEECVNEYLSGEYQRRGTCLLERPGVAPESVFAPERIENLIPALKLGASKNLAIERVF
jgi:hypothetical protein